MSGLVYDDDFTNPDWESFRDKVDPNDPLVRHIVDNFDDFDNRTTAECAKLLGVSERKALRLLKGLCGAVCVGGVCLTFSDVGQATGYGTARSASKYIWFGS